MTDTALYESICKQADAAKYNLKKLDDLLSILWTNKSRLSESQFDFAKDHILDYYEAQKEKNEAEETVRTFLKKNNEE